MSSATAFVLVGTPHPNDNGINPEWMLELWEGSVARWVVRHLAGAHEAVIVEPESPRDITAALVRCVLQLAENQNARFSVIVTALENSSLQMQREHFPSLDNFDFHILAPIYSRTLSSWTGRFHETMHNYPSLKES